MAARGSGGRGNGRDLHSNGVEVVWVGSAWLFLLVVCVDCDDEMRCDGEKKSSSYIEEIIQNGRAPSEVCYCSFLQSRRQDLENATALVS